MFQSLTMVIWFLVAITILVAIHEYGHYLAARLCGVRVIRYSIGFGRILYSVKDKSGTEFAISAIPLGGYLKMLDAREVEVAPEDYPSSFNAKHPAQKIIIAAAGPFANFVLAFFAYWVLSMQGTLTAVPVIGHVVPDSPAFQAGISADQEILAVDGYPVNTRKDVQLRLLERLGETGEITILTRYWEEDYSADSSLTYQSVIPISGWMRGEEAPDMLADLGIKFFQPPVSIVNGIGEGSPAENVGILAGDKIISIDGNYIDGYFDWIGYVGARANVEIEFDVLRENRQIRFIVVPERAVSDEGKSVGRIGVSVTREPYPSSMLRKQEYGLGEAALKAFSSIGETARLILVSLKKLIFGEISAKNLSGPIGIAKVAADHAKHGFFAFLDFLAYLSMMLGVLNLLPIPVLDGGHIVYCAIEWIKGSPLSDRFQTIGFQVGLVLIFGVMMIAFYNDLARL